MKALRENATAILALVVIITVTLAIREYSAADDKRIQTEVKELDKRVTGLDKDAAVRLTCIEGRPPSHARGLAPAGNGHVQRRGHEDQAEAGSTEARHLETRSQKFFIIPFFIRSVYCVRSTEETCLTASSSSKPRETAASRGSVRALISFAMIALTWAGPDGGSAIGAYGRVRRVSSIFDGGDPSMVASGSPTTRPRTSPARSASDFPEPVTVSCRRPCRSGNARCRA